MKYLVWIKEDGKWVEQGDGPLTHPLTAVLCEVHASAPQLREALKLCQSILADHVNHKPVEMCATAEALESARTALHNSKPAEPSKVSETRNTRESLAEALEALRGLFQHCAMVHKHWGEDCNQNQADAAIALAKLVIAKAERRTV